MQNLTNPAANTLSQFQVAAQIARTCVASTNVGLVTNSGWTYHPDAGRYTTANGTSYLLRAREQTWPSNSVSILATEGPITNGHNISNGHGSYY